MLGTSSNCSSIWTLDFSNVLLNATLLNPVLREILEAKSVDDLLDSSSLMLS